jgi:hypothetical protein
MTEGPFQAQDAPHTDGAVYDEVPGDSARDVVVGRLEKNLIGVKIRDADKYNDKTRHLLQTCIHIMPLENQESLTNQLDELVRYARMSRNRYVAKA